MKINKEKFLKTELGGGLQECITSWDIALNNCSKCRGDENNYKQERKVANWCQAQWEVYRLAIKQFYGVEYHFTRTDEYYGVVTEEETDWLFKVMRG